MPTALPAATDFTGASITEAQFKTAITNQRAFLSELLGADGVQATALTALGSLLNGVLPKTAAHTVVAADRGKLIDCTNTWTLTLTAAATLGAGFAFAVRNSGTGTITIDGNSAELVDGASTIALAAGESATLACNGSAWKTLGRMPAATASVNGYMTSTYAAKLDGIAAGANLGVGLDVGASAVGMMALMYMVSGTSVASGGTIAGSSLRMASNGENYHSATPAGTWRNITNAIIYYGGAGTSAGTFQRIS